MWRRAGEAAAHRLPSDLGRATAVRSLNCACSSTVTMSRSSSPAQDSASPAAHDAEHDESPAPKDGSQPPEHAAEKSQAALDEEASPSRATSTSPSATGAAFTSHSAEPQPATSSATPSATSGTWQAVWSPQHSAYYFYNSVTHETTWVNPLEQPNAEAGPSNAAPASSTPEATPGPSSAIDIYAAAAAQGIDPALAHLDPSLAGGSAAPGANTYTAKFNARTGAFARPDARDPSHLSEFERSKRMSEFYFDVNAWESEVEMRKLQEAQEEESRKRKRPTKKDIVSTYTKTPCWPHIDSIFRSATKTRRSRRNWRRRLGCVHD